MFLLNSKVKVALSEAVSPKINRDNISFFQRGLSSKEERSRCFCFFLFPLFINNQKNLAGLTAAVALRKKKVFGKLFGFYTRISKKTKQKSVKRKCPLQIIKTMDSAALS